MYQQPTEELHANISFIDHHSPDSDHPCVATSRPRPGTPGGHGQGDRHRQGLRIAAPRRPRARPRYPARCGHGRRWQLRHPAVARGDVCPGVPVDGVRAVGGHRRRGPSGPHDHGGCRTRPRPDRRGRGDHDRRIFPHGFGRCSERRHILVRRSAPLARVGRRRQPHHDGTPLGRPRERPAEQSGRARWQSVRECFLYRQHPGPEYQSLRHTGCHGRGARYAERGSPGERHAQCRRVRRSLGQPPLIGHGDASPRRDPRWVRGSGEYGYDRLRRGGRRAAGRFVRVVAAVVPPQLPGPARECVLGGEYRCATHDGRTGEGHHRPLA